jgi:hypothetical protein
MKIKKFRIKLKKYANKSFMALCYPNNRAHLATSSCRPPTAATTSATDRPTSSSCSSASSTPTTAGANFAKPFRPKFTDVTYVFRCPRGLVKWISTYCLCLLGSWDRIPNGYRVVVSKL